MMVINLTTTEEGFISASYAKYIIQAKMYIEGIVEKHDIIGAIFGQLDGLLPSSMDLQELQRIGKIDRINVKVSHREGKTDAKIIVPCNMTKLEVAVLAAALESIDRVGPSKAETSIIRIEDIRKIKKENIVKRAAEILRRWDDIVAPENADILKRIEEEAKKSKIIMVGPEKLPAGPGIKTSDEIIVVEGRADVVNLLKHGFDAVIAVEGTHIPKTIIDLSKRKVVTAFVDGDRSGLLILKELLQVADVDYIARAPKGKEVQYLSLKEIKRALSRRIPAENLKIDIEKALSLFDETSESQKETKIEEKKTDEDVNKNNAQKPLLRYMRKLLGTEKFLLLDSKYSKILSGKISKLPELIKKVDKKDRMILLIDGKVSSELLDNIKDTGIILIVGRDIDNKIVGKTKIKVESIETLKDRKA